MANGAFKFKDNSGNVVSFISGSGPNISFSGGTLDLSGMTGLTLGNLTMSGTTQNAVSTSHAATYLLTSSFNSYTGTTNTIIGSLQTSTGSLNTFTSSTDGRLNSIETSTGSLNSYTSSTNTRLGVIESTTGSLNTYTSSTNTRLGVIEGTTSSLNTFTSSANGRLNSIEGKTGSYATTGSNTFNGNLTVTGYIDAQELRTTYISSSILYRSGSTKFGDELTDTHAFTGSLLLSGSLTVFPALTYNNSYLTLGASETSNNIDYNFRILRHGTLANPGTYTSDLPALRVIDWSADGPATHDPVGLVSIEFPRIAEGDTNAGNATLLRVANDSVTALAVTGKGNVHLGQNGSSDTGERLQINGSLKVSSIIKASSSAGSGLRIYGGSGTNQWDMYLTSTNLRFSDNTGGNSLFVVDTTAQIYEFKISKRNNYATSDDSPWIFLSDGQAGGIRPSEYGHVFIQSRSNAARGIGFITGTSPEEKVWIDGTGAKMSIGNNSPQANSTSAVLDIGNGAGGTINLRDTNTGLSAEGFNQIYGGDNRFYIYAGGSGASSKIQFYVNDAEKVTIASNGRLQVGYGSTPNNTAYKFFVSRSDQYGGGIEASSGVVRFRGDDDNLHINKAGTDYITISSSNRVGINQTSPLGILHVTASGTTASAPSLGWPVYNAEADTNARALYFDTGGNGGVATAGYGGTVAFILGQYYDSRAVITTAGSGGASPGDQGTGHGKDLLIKGGTSDNGNGFRGGRLYLNGGAGYQGGYGQNVGDIFMQSIGSGGAVIIGSQYKNDSSSLLQLGSLSNTGGGHLFKRASIASGTATTFFTTNNIDGWCGVVEVFGVCDQDRNRVFYKLARFAYNRVFTEMISSEQNTATTSFTYSGNNLQINIGGTSGLGYYCMIRIMGSTL